MCFCTQFSLCLLPKSYAPLLTRGAKGIAYLCRESRFLELLSKMKIDMYSTRLKALLYYAAKYIGLAPFIIKRNRFYPATLMGQAYSILVAVLFSIWIFYMYYCKSSLIENVTLYRMIFFSWSFMVCTTSICVVFTFAIKSEQFADLMNRINAMDDKLKDLLTTDDWCHEEIKYNWIEKVIKSNAVFLFVSILKEIVIFRIDKKKWNPIIAIGATPFTLYIHNIILIFVQTLLCIRRNFEYLNRNMQSILTSNFDELLLPCDLDNRRIFVVDRKRAEGNQETRNVIDETRSNRFTVKEIKNIKILHRELSDLVESITLQLTTPIFAIMYKHSFRLILVFYDVWARILLSPNGLKNPSVFIPLIIHVVFQLIITIYDMVSVADACASTCKAGNSTRSKLDTIWNKFRPVELKDEFTMFSLQLVHKPLTIRAFGFFDLGYSCLFQIFSAVITYAVIVIQFEPLHQN